MKATRTRRLALSALLAAVALVASACAGGSGEEAEDDQASAPATESPEAQDATETETDDAATAAQGAESCYEGETATFVVSYGPGGGYDQIARMLAPHLEEELGATVVVENQEGAGGLLAANSLLTAEPDGLTFGFFSGQGQAGSVLGGQQGVQFDLLDFTYIARVSADPRVLNVGAQTEYETIEDVRGAQGFTFASAGPGGSDHIDATVLYAILDIEGDIITGFDGSAETELAVTSGDTDAASGTFGSRYPPIQSGDHRAVLVIGDEPIEEIPDVPVLTELDLPEDKMALAEAHVALQNMGRMVWAPPEVPEECAAELTAAFEAALSNPELVEQLEQAAQEIGYLSGEDARAVAESILEAPEEYVALLEQAYSSQ